MSYMPNIGTQVETKDGRVAWVSQITPDGSDDRVIFEDGHEEKIDQMTGFVRIIGEEAAFGFEYPYSQRMLNLHERWHKQNQAKITFLRNLRKSIKAEEEFAFNNDQVTEFMKWWHSYTRGMTDTMKESIATDAWNAATDILLKRIEAILKYE